MRVLDGLTALQLAVAEGFTLLPAPCSTDQVATIVNARRASVVEAAAELRELALIWDPPPPLRVELGPSCARSELSATPSERR